MNFFLYPHAFLSRVMNPTGRQETWGGGGLQNGLKSGGDGAHPKSTPFQQYTPKAAFAASLPWDSRARPRDARRDKLFGPEGESNLLGRLTRETCAWEPVVLPLAPHLGMRMGACRLTTCAWEPVVEPPWTPH